MPLAIISLFEHEFLPFTASEALPLDPARREEILKEVERINEIHGRVILQVERQGFRATQYVGLVRVGDIIFEILPKIAFGDAVQGTVSSKNHQSENIQTASHNFLIMLSYAFDIKLYGTGRAGFSTQICDWYELLIQSFTVELHRQILSGLDNGYQRVAVTSPILRGQWKINKQIPRERPRPAFEIQYDRFSTDTPLNQVFRFILNRLSRQTRNPENARRLAELLRSFAWVTDRSSITPEWINSIQFNRLNDRFREAFRLASLFVSGQAARPAPGVSQAFSFVFDMNILYERFITAFLCRHRRDIFASAWESLDMIIQSSGIHCYLATWGDRNVVPLRPDLIFQPRLARTPSLIVDMKYKPIRPDRQGPGISRNDVYQMLAYSVQMDCPKVLLIYPELHEAGPVRMQYQLPAAKAQLSIQTVNLNQPLDNPRGLIQEFQEIFSSL